jgi:hypothetical protein
MHFLVVVVIVLLGMALGLKLWQQADERSAAKGWAKLATRARSTTMTFDPSRLNGLPEPARR